MSKIAESLKETARVEIRGAFPETLLNACAMNAIEFWDMECVDAYTLRMSIYEQRYGELEAQAARCMCDVKLIRLSGGRTLLKLLYRRRRLVLFALLAAALLVVLSLYIWDFDIYGNEKLSRAQILRTLEECGVESGTYWPSLSSDLVRSRMVELLPELAWMSVNVSGSRAEILVVEREEKPEIYLESAAADIIAGRNAITSKLSVLNGQPLVTAGQAVMEGETLVSGEMRNLVGETRYVRASARVDADTWYEITAVSPAETELKTEIRARRSRFAIQIGKKRINFYFGGRNDIDGCDKIIHKYKASCEGLFSLPLTLIREELVYYDTEIAAYSREDAMFRQLYAQLADSVDGTVLDHSFSSAEISGVTYAKMQAHCLENIALIREIQP